MLKRSILLLIALSLSALLFSDVNQELDKIESNITSIKKSTSKVSEYKNKLLEIEKETDDPEIGVRALGLLVDILRTDKNRPEIGEIVSMMDEKYPDQKEPRALAHLKWGHELRYSNQPSESNKHFQIFLNLYGKPVISTYFYMAINYEWLRDYENSHKFREEGLKSSQKENPESGLKMLKICLHFTENTRNYDEVIKVSKQLIKYYPESLEAYAKTPMVINDLLKYGQAEEALIFVESVLLQTLRRAYNLKNLLQLYARTQSALGNHSYAIYLSFIQYCMINKEDPEDIKEGISVVINSYRNADDNLDRIISFLEFEQFGLSGKDGREGTDDDIVDPSFGIFEKAKDQEMPGSFEKKLMILQDKAKGTDREIFLNLIGGRPFIALKKYSDMNMKPKLPDENPVEKLCLWAALMEYPQEKRDALKDLLSKTQIEVYLMTAKEFTEEKEYTKAIEELKRVAEQYPSSPQGNEAVKEVVSNILKVQGPFENKMSKYIEWVKKLSPETQGIALLTAAETYLNVSQYKKAEELIRKVADGDYPDNVNAMVGYLQACLKISELDFNEALKMLNEVYDGSKKYGFEDKVVFCKAWCLIVLDRKQEGIALIKTFKKTHKKSDITYKMDLLLKQARKK